MRLTENNALYYWFFPTDMDAGRRAAFNALRDQLDTLGITLSSKVNRLFFKDSQLYHVLVTKLTSNQITTAFIGLPVTRLAVEAYHPNGVSVYYMGTAMNVYLANGRIVRFENEKLEDGTHIKDTKWAEYA